jgi:hypothetical protein
VNLVVMVSPSGMRPESRAITRPAPGGALLAWLGVGVRLRVRVWVWVWVRVRVRVIKL